MLHSHIGFLPGCCQNRFDESWKEILQRVSSKRDDLRHSGSSGVGEPRFSENRKVIAQRSFGGQIAETGATLLTLSKP